MDERFAGAICLPASCSSEIVVLLMKRIFTETDFSLTMDYDQEAFCQVRETKKLKFVAYIAM
jgi:hypothetical protein